MDMTTFFQSGMPGVVAATFTPQGGAGVAINVQWYSEPAYEVADSLQLGMVSMRAKGLTSVLGDANRGDTLTVGGVVYHVADAHSDGHGVTTMELER